MNDRTAPFTVSDSTATPPELHLRSRIILVAIAGIAALVSAVCAVAAQLEYTLVAESSVLDFGTLRQGAKVEVVFSLTNRSFQTIEIADVSPNCECADVAVSPKQLAPFATATVRGMWDLGGRRHRTETDLLLYYRHRGGPTRYLDLSLHAVVTPDVEYTPDRLVFESDSPCERRLSFTPLSGSGVAVHEAYVTHKAFKAQLVKASNEVVVSFEPKGWSDDGPAAQPQLVLRTTGHGDHEVVIELELTRKNP